MSQTITDATDIPARTPRGNGRALIFSRLAEIRADLAALLPRKEVWRRHIEALGLSYSQFCRMMAQLVGPAARDFVEAIKAAAGLSAAPAAQATQTAERKPEPTPKAPAVEAIHAEDKPDEKAPAVSADTPLTEKRRQERQMPGELRLEKPAAPEKPIRPPPPADNRPKGFIINPFPKPEELY
jgi:hypothetical protein